MKNIYNSNFILTVIGIIFVSLSLLVNQFTWIAFFDDDNFMSVRNKIIMWLINLLLIILGIIILFYRKNKKKLFFTLFLIAFMFLSLEVALRISHYAISLIRNEAVVDKRYFLSPYQGKDWAYNFWIDHNKSWNTDYESFLGWDRKEYHSKYTNVDSFGIRKTWAPSLKSKQNNNEETIFMFGGSTLWGTGARDNYTIPSYLSKFLNENNYRFKVINYGETGYVFFQELIHLVLLLRKGHRPDYVIFYDGVNDVYSAYQNGIAGQIENIQQIRKKINFSYPTHLEQLKNVIIYFISLKWTKIYESLGRLGNYIIQPENKFREVASNYNKVKLEKLAVDITEHYKASITLLEGLSKIYGFKYLLFWQPVIYTEENITDEEEFVDKRIQDKSARRLYQHVNDIFQKNSITNFHSIPEVLKNRKETFYIDFCHLSEGGNRIVAQKIYAIFEKNFLIND